MPSIHFLRLANAFELSKTNDGLTQSEAINIQFLINSTLNQYARGRLNILINL